MNYVFRVPDAISRSVKPVQLRNCTGYQITPPYWEHGKAILYLHGGAMCLPMWKFYLPIAYKLAVLTNSRVLLPDYRLAPDYPYPAAVDDCMDGARWIADSWAAADEIVVIGDSAGGNLALNTAIRSDSLRGLAMMSPWLDLSHSSKWWQENNLDDVVFPIPARRAAWLYTLGSGDWTFGKGNSELESEFELRIRDPGVSPILADLSFATDIPVLIQVGRDERLLGDSLAMWDGIGGVLPQNALQPLAPPLTRLFHNHHELSIWTGVPHVWQVTRPWASQAKMATEQLAQFVNRLYPK